MEEYGISLRSIEDPSISFSMIINELTSNLTSTVAFGFAHGDPAGSDAPP